MHSHRHRSRSGAALAAGLASALALSTLVSAPAFAAPADTDAGAVSVSDAVFSWGLNSEVGNRAFAPGTYNFLSAGIAPKTDAADTITEAEWQAVDGNVTIQKPQPDGSLTTATWAGLKTDPSGAAITSPTGGRYSGVQVAIGAGVGTLDAANDSADIQWDGDFTVAFYSGMTQFSVSDPHLVVEGATGTVTATLTGYGTSMDDTSVFTELPAQEVVLATLAQVDVTDTGIDASPDYLGVALDLPGTATPQSSTGASWGAFPQSFIDYQLLTGQGSYWYSSGGSTDAAKVAKQIVVTATPDETPTVPTDPGVTEITSATVEFGFNNVHQGAAPAGGCNYFVAGAVTGLGSDYQSVDGDVYVVKKHSDGTSEVVDAATRCTAAEGSSFIDQRFLFTEGEGTSGADGTDIQWTGAGTVNAYGGLVSWYFENPELVLDASGNGSITARVGGFGSSMDDPTVKVPLDPREGVEIATVAGATVVDGTITIDPVWTNVDYFPLTVAGDETSPRRTTSAIPDAAKLANPNWGSWPESFVDFQYATGLSSYWHTSGLSADPNKPPLPIEVDLDGQAPDFGVLIVAQPTSAQLSEGDDVTFTGRASSGAGALTIQWQAKKAGGDWADIAGATGEQLTLTDVQVAEWNGALVRFVATAGASSAISGEASLSVTAPALPAFTVQPQDVAALVDGSAYFEAHATGYPRPTFQWERKGADGTWVAQTDSSAWVDSPGVFGTSFNLWPVTIDADGSEVRVVATNASGSVASDAVTLTVQTKAPSITYQPDDLWMYEGGSGYMFVGIDGAPYPTVTWEKSTDGGATWAIDDTMVGDFLEFPTVTADLDGVQYRATATNEFGSAVSDAAGIHVLDAADGIAHLVTTQLDPSVDTRVDWVLGQLPAFPAGAQGQFVAGIIEKSAWQPGDAPVTFESFVPGAAGRYDAGDWSFRADGTWVFAGSLDPAKEYGFAWMWVPAAGGAAMPQYDVYLPLTLTTSTTPVDPTDPTDPVDPTDPTDPVTPVVPTAPPVLLTDAEVAAAPRGDVSIVSIDGDSVQLSVGASHAGEYVSVEVHSTPQFLGWHLVSSAGIVQVTVPTSTLEAGTHTLVVRAADGSVIGTVDITVSATGGVVTDPATASSTVAALPSTGAEPFGALWFALAALLLGAGGVGVRRMRARS